MPGCNGQDTVKVRQGKPSELIANRRSGESRLRRLVPLVRSTVGNDKSARSKYDGPTGKRSAVKVACSVWSGGKAASPYLSLQNSESSLP